MPCVLGDQEEQELDEELSRSPEEEKDAVPEDRRSRLAKERPRARASPQLEGSSKGTADPVASGATELRTAA